MESRNVHLQVLETLQSRLLAGVEQMRPLGFPWNHGKSHMKHKVAERLISVKNLRSGVNYITSRLIERDRICVCVRQVATFYSSRVPKLQNGTSAEASFLTGTGIILVSCVQFRLFSRTVIGKAIEPLAPAWDITCTWTGGVVTS